MTGEPTFLLGMGAQKAGTTWLFDYLDAHPDCAMGPFKEMNFFQMPGRGKDGQVRQMRNPAWKMSRHLEEDRDARIAAELDAQLIRHRPSHYAAIYARIAAENPGARLVGDLSPKYATLGAKGMTRMKRYLDGMGYPVRVVMLLRDPVRRCFSAARMAERGQGAVGKRSRKTGGETAEFSGEDFLRFATGPASAPRTRYDETIARLESVFAPDQLFYGLYEEFFTPSEVERLCRFLGIRFEEPRFDVRPHADARTGGVPEPVAQKLRSFYADTYAFCRDRFGAERIDALWGG